MVKHREYWALLAILCLVPLLASAAGDEDKLTKLIERWREARDKANVHLLEAFDQMDREVTRSKTIPAETKANYLTSLREQREDFDNYAMLPEDDAMLPAVIAYLDTIHTSALPVFQSFENAMQEAVRMKGDVERIAAVKDKWLEELPDAGAVQPRTAFHGNRRWKNGVTLDFHLHINKFEKNSFNGAIWQDVHSIPGKTGWEYHGKLEGNQMVLVSTKMLHGAQRRIEFRGYVIGDRIVMTVTSINGKRQNGDFISLWKK